MGNFLSRFRTLSFALLIAAPSAAAAAEVASGIFLVATEELLDPNFRETVVLVTQPQSGGPFGVIINRPLNHRLSEIFPEIEALKDKQDVVFSGGPVARQGLVFLVRARKPPPSAIRVLKDVYITADPVEADELLKRSDPTTGLRVYAGHAGWAPGQLQDEITRGGWQVLPADAETVFEKDAVTIWPELSRRAALQRTRSTKNLSAACY
jgi:putative transcriptional regulator